jgi:cytochrome P450
MTMTWQGMFDDLTNAGNGADYRGSPTLSPKFWRAGFSALRTVMPVAQFGKSVLVTRYADVVEVLDDQEHFHVPYTRSINRSTGPFILGMDDRESYESEVEFLRAAVRKDDLDFIRRLTRERAGELLEQARTRGKLDVAGDYARKIALRVVADYLGVQGPNEQTLTRWTQAIFLDLFLNLTANPRISLLAVDAALEFNRHLDTVAHKLRANSVRTRATAGSRAAGQHPPTADTFFARLVQQQAEYHIDDAGVRRNIAGMVVGALDTITKAIVLSFDQLLEHPLQLAAARAAARAGDVDLVAKYTFEALRFNPHNPIILRRTHRDFRLARGTPRECVVKEGTTVIAATMSAMFDDSVLPDPSQFRIGREPKHYLHFGRGRHTCFGERLNGVVVPEAIMALLSCDELTRAPGKLGRVCASGPFPDRMVVQLGRAG